MIFAFKRHRPTRRANFFLPNGSSALHARGFRPFETRASFRRFFSLTQRRAPTRAPFFGDWLAPVYCSSLVTSCWMLLAWARAEMPVWLRISYLDMLDAADA